MVLFAGNVPVRRWSGSDVKPAVPAAPGLALGVGPGVVVLGLALSRLLQPPASRIP